MPDNVPARLPGGALKLVRWTALAGAAGFCFVAFSGVSVSAGVGLVCVAVLMVLSLRAATIVLLTLLPMDLVGHLFGRVFVDFSELMLATVILVWIGCHCKGLRRTDWRPMAWAAPFLAAAFLSSAAANEWYRVLPNVLRPAELFVAMWLAAQMGRKAVSVKSVFLVAAAVHSLVGMTEFPISAGGRSFTFFSNPNPFAAYLGLLLPVLLVWTIRDSDPARRRWAGGGVALLSWTLVLAQSRAALATSIVVAGVIFVLEYRRQSARPELSFWQNCALFLPTLRMILLATLTIVPLFLFYLTLFPAGAGAAFERYSKALKWRSSESISAGYMGTRGPFLALGWQMWSDRPWLGVGPGNYSRTVGREYGDYVDSYQNQVLDFDNFRTVSRQHLHNLFAQLAVVYGVVGLLGFLYFAGKCLRWGWKNRCDPYGLAFLAVFTGVLLHNLLDVTLFSLRMEIGFVLGLCLAGADRPGAG